MVKSPALREPPMEAEVPGFMAPVPEVNVSEPPGFTMSNFDTTAAPTFVSKARYASLRQLEHTLSSHGRSPELDSEVVLRFF